MTLETLDSVLPAIDDTQAEVTGSEKEQPEQEQTPAEQPADKFSDWSREAAIENYRNLERTLGRQGNELGQLRQMVDQWVQKDFEKKEEEPTPDFYEDPEAAVKRIVADALKQNLAPVSSKIADVTAARTADQLTQTHPNWRDTVSSDGFRAWVSASQARQLLFNRASYEYDYDSARELLDNYNLVSQRNAPIAAAAAEERKKQRSDATLETGGTGESAKKTYKRQDIINLKANQPDKYRRLLPEIEAAYREGRVK